MDVLMKLATILIVLSASSWALEDIGTNRRRHHKNADDDSDAHKALLDRIAKETVDKYLEELQSLGVQDQLNNEDDINVKRSTLQNKDCLADTKEAIEHLALKIEEAVGDLNKEVGAIADSVRDLGNVITNVFPNGIPIEFDDASRQAFYSIADSVDHVVVCLVVSCVILFIVSVLHSVERLYVLRMGRRVVQMNCPAIKAEKQ